MIVLGVDYGRRKIGLAVGDSQTGLVEPWGTAVNHQLPACRQDRSVISNIQKLISQRGIELIVVGMTGGEIDKEIRQFSSKIKKIIGLPVEFFDETLTTQLANQILGQNARTRKYKKSMEDAIAAAVMLQLYLEREGQHV